MASKRSKKQVKQKETVSSDKVVMRGGEPDQYYNEKPKWNFNSIDDEQWAFSQEHVGNLIWDEIIPCLQAYETRTWGDILIKSKKNNHSINVEHLNKPAQDRLAQRYIEEEALISLRLSGTHRLYGYMNGSVFNILWYDDDHGDNSTCVCRSRKKHT